MFDRSAMVTWLVERLAEDVGVAVGDHGAPDGVGWTDGEPNVGSFIPYLVVTTDVATPMREPLQDMSWDWRVQLSVRGWTEERAKTDRLLMQATDSLLKCRRVCEFPVVGEKITRYVIDHVQVDSLSGIQINKQFKPYLYSAGVSLTCMTMKKR